MHLPIKQRGVLRIIKSNTIYSYCRWFLLVVACSLSIYHCLYTLLGRQLAIPRIFQYAEYLLVLLFAIAVFFLLLVAIRKHCTIHATANPCKNWYFALLMIFFLFLCISSLLLEQERAGAFRYNLGCLYDAGISLFVLFPLGFWFGSREDFRLLNGIIGIITIVYLAIVLYGLYGISFDQEITIAGSAVYIKLGRLCLGAHNPNTTGMFCALLMSTGLYRILSGNKATRAFYIFAVVVFYVCLIQTDSRSSILAVSISFGAYAGIYYWHRYNKCKKKVLSFLLSGLVSLIALIIILFGRYSVILVSPIEAIAIILVMITLFCWYSRISGRFLRVAAAVTALIFIVFGIIYGPTLLSAIKSTAVTTRKLFTSGGAGRIRLWAVVLDLLRENRDYLLRGCGPYYIGEAVLPLYGKAFSTHNQFLEIAFAYGLPSLVVFLAWLVVLARRSLYMIKAPSNILGLEYKVLPLILMLLLINNMFEYSLLFYRYITGCMFFLVAGYICSDIFVPSIAPGKTK